MSRGSPFAAGSLPERAEVRAPQLRRREERGSRKQRANVFQSGLEPLPERQGNERQQEQAEQYFEQALQTFRKSGMRLEYARTLHEYGTALLRQGDQENQERRRSEEALAYLREASQVFTSCKASLDAQVVERLLASYEQVTEK